MMSDDESFLARWSRRKRSAMPAARGQSKPENGDGGAAPEASASPPLPRGAQPPVDPANLPPIESLGAESDIRAFLAAGVPAELTRAALRHAWAADPAIRDFIGLSENSWDFNAPDGVPGFGTVKAEDVRRLVARVMGEPEAVDAASSAPESAAGGQAGDPIGQSGSAAEPDRQQPLASGPAQEQPKQRENAATEHRGPTDQDNVYSAMQHEPREREYSPPLPRRGHGGALPE
jgi:hypothetical protein